jgi:hypothetical protein
MALTVEVTLTGEVHMEIKLEATGEVGGSRGAHGGYFGLDGQGETGVVLLAAAVKRGWFEPIPPHPHN